MLKLKGTMEGHVPALLSAGSNGLVMALVLLMVTTRLSPEAQGLFFTFLSFAALAQLVDFGLAYATMQTASHLQADYEKMAALKRQALRISVLTTIVALPVIELAGFFTLSRGHIGMSAEADWYLPWLFYIPAILGGLPITTLLAIREGGGAIGPVWRLRAYQEWLTGAILLAALLGDAGLWSLVLSAGARPVIGGVWLALTRPMHSSAPTPASRIPQRLDWRTEIWPFQWKIGISFLCGFFIFRAITPVVLFERGEIVAGQIGIAINVMNMAIAISSAWPTSQAARYGSLLASRAYDLLQVEFRHTLLWSTVLCAATIMCAGLSLQMLGWMLPAIADRLPSFLVTALFLGAALFHHIVACFAAPLRAERREPFLLASIIGSMLTIFALWLAARYGGSLTIALTNLVCAAAGLPIAIRIFHKRFNIWNHA